MNSLAWIYSCALVMTLVPSFAAADEPSLTDWTQTRVQEGLIKPLSAREARGTHRFSRARPAPQERRIRVLAPTATVDKNGLSFVPFAVDARFGSDWIEDDVVGCVYRASGKLFIKFGDVYRPASILLGKDEGVADAVCEAAPHS